MSQCPQCNTSFSFIDVLKSFNPTNIPCSNCSSKISSSYVSLGLFVLASMIVLAGFWFIPIAESLQILKYLGVVCLAVLAEYLYFVFLDKGIIKSNLQHAPPKKVVEAQPEE